MSPRVVVTQTQYFELRHLLPRLLLSFVSFHLVRQPTMASVASSPLLPVITTHTRTGSSSNSNSDESSVYELSFDYTKDEEGKWIRVSKRPPGASESTPSTPAISSPLTGAGYEYDSKTVDGPGVVQGLQVPRRSSLSRSESSPYPYPHSHAGESSMGTSWEPGTGREWKRTNTTPSNAQPVRPKSFAGILDEHDPSTYEKENQGLNPCKYYLLYFSLYLSYNVLYLQYLRKRLLMTSTLSQDDTSHYHSAHPARILPGRHSPLFKPASSSHRRR